MRLAAGFTYGLQLANSLISSGMHHKILVIGAETLKITDYTDRSTCILFGDGAGALSRVTKTNQVLLDKPMDLMVVRVKSLCYAHC